MAGATAIARGGRAGARFRPSLAYVIYYALIRRAGGTNTILVTLLIPVGGVFFAWALLGEAFTLGGGRRHAPDRARPGRHRRARASRALRRPDVRPPAVLGRPAP